ncbi:hypothetical protein TanjilG_11717 [Lupinus angustifolius]|uniref:Cell wall protein n=1 Tax=Lupinus angustifolius TaxID=3871 RepID=A0A1J7GZW5_LUPAN|nr:PREDICTED: putative cell wall protein [Lupinus angustifolius]OIW06030.1 hypothetical protein TanjilG_11717 [Lupinus angustifolius]
MVYKASFFLALILVSNILLAVNVAGRSIGKNSNNPDKKEPQFFFRHEHIGFPPAFGIRPHNPFSGGAGTGTGRSYVPGGDDTFVPNPGFEVPIPGGGGRVTPGVHP